MSILLPFLALLLVGGIAAYHRFSLAVFTALAASVLVALALAGSHPTATLVAGIVLALATLPILVTPFRQRPPNHRGLLRKQ